MIKVKTILTNKPECIRQKQHKMHQRKKTNTNISLLTCGVDKIAASVLLSLGCTRTKYIFQKLPSLMYPGHSSILRAAKLGARCSTARACSCCASDKSKSKRQQNFRDSEMPGTIKYHTKYTNKHLKKHVRGNCHL